MIHYIASSDHHISILYNVPNNILLAKLINKMLPFSFIKN